MLLPPSKRLCNILDLRRLKGCFICSKKTYRFKKEVIINYFCAALLTHWMPSKIDSMICNTYYELPGFSAIALSALKECDGGYNHREAKTSIHLASTYYYSRLYRPSRRNHIFWTCRPKTFFVAMRASLEYASNKHCIFVTTDPFNDRATVSLHYKCQ